MRVLDSQILLHIIKETFVKRHRIFHSQIELGFILSLNNPSDIK